MDTHVQYQFTNPIDPGSGPCNSIEIRKICVQQENNLLQGGIQRLGSDEVLQIIGIYNIKVNTELHISPRFIAERLPSIMGN